MNVLILTPDRVGSTLLQRLITVYMIRKGFDRPVINLHELSNGLEKYFNSSLQQEVLGKPQGVGWGYFQTLPEVVDLLDSVDHYKTSRLAHYHLVNRQDSIGDQIKFYEYLNKNFFIISCQRENLLEHALSWLINSHSKRLNVYSPAEKVDVFANLYQDGITATQQSLEKHLDNYVKYDQWVKQYFNVQSYFNYDHDIIAIEDYILNLDFMQNSTANTWKDMFGQSFTDWNACHRLLPNLLLRDPPAQSDTKTLTFASQNITDQKWKELRGPDWPADWRELSTANLPAVIQQEIDQLFNTVSIAVTQNEYNFLAEHIATYKNTVNEIETLKEHGHLVTGVPLKLQSLTEKKHIIKNFDQCVGWYNQWVEKNNFGKLYTQDELNTLAIAEEEKLTAPVGQQLAYTGHKRLSS